MKFTAGLAAAVIDSQRALMRLRDDDRRRDDLRGAR